MKTITTTFDLTERFDTRELAEDAATDYAHREHRMIVVMVDGVESSYASPMFGLNRAEDEVDVPDFN